MINFVFILTKQDYILSVDHRDIKSLDIFLIHLNTAIAPSSPSVNWCPTFSTSYWNDSLGLNPSVSLNLLRNHRLLKPAGLLHLHFFRQMNCSRKRVSMVCINHQLNVSTDGLSDSRNMSFSTESKPTNIFSALKPASLNDLASFTQDFMVSLTCIVSGFSKSVLASCSLHLHPVYKCSTQQFTIRNSLFFLQEDPKEQHQCQK